MSGTGEGGLGAIKKIPFTMAKFLLTKKCLFSRYHCSSSLTMR